MASSSISLAPKPSRTRRAPARRLQPSREAISEWLCRSELRRGGEVLSWRNPAHPGYPYPEASALWLSWAAWRVERGETPPAAAGIREVAQSLSRQLEHHGSIGRNEHSYLFDTCLAVHALARAQRVGLLSETEWPALALRDFLREDSPVLPPSGSGRWSVTWSGHLSRSAALLFQAGGWCGKPEWQATARAIRARSAGLGDLPGYLHAALYAIEGELLFGALGEPWDRDSVLAFADRLSELQRPDGLFPAWIDGRGTRLDATAQAVRVWTRTDATGQANRIDRALDGLARLQQPAGGLPYALGSADLNTWVGIFADQACAWARGGASATAWL